MANHRNPIGIIVPCHRVIGANGALVGYGGGLAMKQWLLEHEGAIVPALPLGAPDQSSVLSSSRSTNAPPTQDPSGIAT